MKSQYHRLKQEAFEANMQLPKLGLVVYTFGNVSAFDRAKGVFAIKPSGVPYEKLKAHDMVVVDLDNRKVEGKLQPSSDTPTHSVLYRKLAGIGGVLHTHSPYAVAWAQAGRDIPLLGTTHADHLGVDVPCAKILSDERVRGDYEAETGRQMAECLAARRLKPLEAPMMLVAGHGPFAWGSDAAKAVYHGKMLEELARMAWLTLALAPKQARLKKSLVDKHYLRKHGPNAYYGQDKDRP
jgi:L-ribulose-5-phosphate 4-epimerase